MRYLHWLVVSILVILVSSLLLLGTSCNCQNQVTTGSPSTTPIKGKLFIWKVSGTTHIYLLGSVHLASQNLYPLDSMIENAFESADNLVVEVNTSNVSQESVSRFVMQYGAYPLGDGFKKNVSEDVYNQLENQFKEYSVNITQLDNFKPWVIYSVISQAIFEDLGYKSEYGIDNYFLDKAVNNGKNILELETTEYQLALMSSIPDEISLKMMQYDVGNPETDDYLQRLLDAWVDGDAANMEAIVFEALYEEPELSPYYEIAYEQRNYQMVPKIEGFLAGNEVYFVVVGAGHLVGENGLINLLKNKGYVIEQLDNSD
jgi:uncharacterized protein YbaP (TraB family)